MWPNPQETADLVTFTENILNGKVHILCSVCCAIPVFSNQYISTQKEDGLTLNEWTELNEWTNWIERSYFQLLKTTESDSNIAMTNQLLENVCRSVITKFWKFPKIVNIMFLRKFKKPILPFQIAGFILVFFFVCVSPVFIFFHSHFWLSLEQQSGKGHVSIRCQISVKFFVIAMILWLKQDMMPYWIYRKII